MTASRLHVSRLATLFVLPLGLTLGGCTELDAYLPSVSFDRVDVDSVDWEEISSDFVFKVNNPNPIEVKLARFDYALAFGGVEWAVGDDPDGLVLDASSGSEIALPVDIVFQSLYDMVQATRGEDNIAFGLNGSFGFNTPAGVVDLPYDADGDFPALRSPGITYDRLRVDELSLSGATIELDLDIDNDHASNLMFNNFDYQLSLNGTDVGVGFLDLLAEVDGASSETVSVPLELDFVDVGTAIYSALTENSVTVGLDAVTEVDTPFGVVPLAIDQSGNVEID
jgi:LEA14-like dessication related protein